MENKVTDLITKTHDLNTNAKELRNLKEEINKILDTKIRVKDREEEYEKTKEVMNSIEVLSKKGKIGLYDADGDWRIIQEIQLNYDGDIVLIY